MHISIIDDEKVLTSKISKKLQLNWYSVSEFYSFKEFMSNCTHDDISDLYIIDISLWDGSGFDIIKFLRNEKKSQTPIIITSWFWDTQNIIFWLELWADDYMTKPFSPEELLARIKAISRRPRVIDEVQEEIKYKNIVINNTTKEIKVNWEKVEFARKESLILDLFITNVWKIIEKDKLIKYVWWVQSAIDVTDNTINATLSKLRKKLWDNFPLQTIHNIWYVLE